MPSAVGELVDEANQVAAKKLGLIDGDHARVIVELTADRIHVGDRDRRESKLTVRGDRLDRVAIIQGGLERLDG